MKGFNKVTIAGNLTRDPELTYTPSGVAKVRFSVAINRTYNTKEGEKKEEVLFLEVNAWRKLAEICNQYVKKGSPILVDGRLRENRWTDNEGKERLKIYVEASDILLLPRGGERQTDAAVDADEPFDASDEDVPF